MTTGRLAGKTALVTGAGQGIGRAIVEAFARESAAVIATDRDPELLKGMARVAGVSTRCLDVTDAEGIRACAAENSEVDVLVNCAGVVANGSVLDCSDEDWELAVSVNAKAIFHMIRAFLPEMLQRGNGNIINVASVVSSVKGAPERFAYGASKASVIGITKSVAIDFIDRGIRCNSICPGTVDSPSLRERMRAGGDYERTRQAFVDRQPMGRLGRVEEIAAVAVMLASDESAYMSGSAVVIDGGWSI